MSRHRGSRESRARFHEEIVAAVGGIIRANPTKKLDELQEVFRRWFKGQPEAEREALTDAILNVLFVKVREGITGDEDD